MKKVVNITIGGIVFSIEEDAYEVLSAYLADIRAHFEPSDTQGEIVDDIEVSVAEKFTRVKKGSVVTKANVDTVIAELGTVEDFQKELDEVEPVGSEAIGSDGKVRKRLYRDVDDQIIAGVASGIAAYLGVDAVFVRLAFFIALFFNGLGFIAYIILWIVMPKAETVAQKLEMQGDPVSLQQIEKSVKEKLAFKSEVKTDGFTRVLKLPFVFLKHVAEFLKRVFKSLGPVVRILVGSIVVFASAAALIGITVAATGFHFSVTAGVFELPVYEFLTGGEYALGVTALALLFLIPAFLAVTLGWSLLKRENKFSGMLLGVLGVVWLASLVGAGHTASVIVPKYQAYVANMPTTTVEEELAEFSGVSIFTGDSVVVQQGEESSITLTGKEASVEDRVFEVHNGVLEIRNAKTSGLVCIGCFNPPVEIVITTPSLDSVIAAHSTRVTIEELETQTLKLDLRHSSRGDVGVVAERIDIQLAHSSRLELGGEAAEVIGEIRHSSRLDTTELLNTKTSLDLAHSSRATVGETETLSVIARHSSSVTYEGEPELDVDTQHSSSVRKKF